MNHDIKSEKQRSETFSVEEGYLTYGIFFGKLCPLIESKVIKEKQDFYNFFCLEICSWNEYCAEWNEAVYRVTNIPKEQQLTLQLSLSQIFECTLECCKLHNKHCENKVINSVKILEGMKEVPEQYQVEWKIWQEAVSNTQRNSIHYDNFDWHANQFHF
ncbi:MAG: hypothetical protein ACRCSV_02255 [Chlamydiales bacterium]